MGWSTGYTIYEDTVVSAYNTGQLTPELLKAIIAPYKDTDIDHGGKQDLKATDGLSADEIVLKLLRPKEFADYVELEHILSLTAERDYDADEEAYAMFYSHWYDLVVRGNVETEESNATKR